MTLHILDEEGDTVPPCVPGRLYVGGVGVATGYLNNAVATKERFQTLGSGGLVQRLYKTDDVAERSANNSVVVHGKMADLIDEADSATSTKALEKRLCTVLSVEECALVHFDDGEVPRKAALFLGRALKQGRGGGPSNYEMEVCRAAESFLSATTETPFVVRVHHFDRLPRALSGKIHRPHLVAEALRLWEAST